MYRSHAVAEISNRFKDCPSMIPEVFSRLSPGAKKNAAVIVRKLAPKAPQSRRYQWLNKQYFLSGFFVNSTMVMTSEIVDSVFGDVLGLSLFAAAGIGNGFAGVLSIWISGAIFATSRPARKRLVSVSFGLGLVAGMLPLQFR